MSIQKAIERIEKDLGKFIGASRLFDKPEWKGAIKAFEQSLLVLKEEAEKEKEVPCERCKHYDGENCLTYSCTHIKWNKRLYPDLFEPKEATNEDT